MTGGTLIGRDDLLRDLDASVRRGVGPVLVGPAGVGKSHVLAALAQRFAPDQRVERFVATEPMQSIPFGPLLSILPTGGEDQGQLLAEIRRRLVALTGDRRTLVVVDDAHLLDDSSLACVVDIARSGDAIVAMTVRSDEPVIEPLVRLWTSGVMERVEVRPLETDAVAELVEDVLDGPASPDLVDSVVEAADGNPLLSRELVLDGRDSGAIVQRDREWHLDGGLRPGVRITEIARSRIATLGAAARELAEIIALVEPVDASLVDDDDALLDLLERRQLIRIETMGERTEVRSDHPLIGAALRSGLTEYGGARLLGRLARRAIAAGWPRRGDALRTVYWCRASRVPVPVDLAVAGAGEATDVLDLALASDLIDAALQEADGWELHYHRGNVHRLLGDPDAAEASFSRAASRAETDDAVARVAYRRSWVHVHLRGDPQTAVDMLREAAGRIVDPEPRSTLEHTANNFSGLLGHYDEVERVNRELLATADPGSDTAGVARRELAYAQVVQGKPTGVRSLIEQDLAVGHRPDVADLLRSLRCTAYLYEGELERGDRQASADVERCRAQDALHSSVGVRWGLLLHLRGDGQVHDVLDGVGRELERADPFGLRTRHRAVWAAALADAGRLDEANRLLDEVPNELDDVRSLALLGRARAAVMGRSGGTELACTIAGDAGRDAIEATQIGDGLLALHEATRLGHPEIAVDATADLVDGELGRLLIALLADARAAVAGDGKALALVGDDLAAMGATFFAAEAMTRACRMLDDLDSFHARRVDARAQLLASTTAFPVDETTVVDRLSARELEITVAALAAQTSRAIAEEKFLSVRTVDNHLRRVYRKLDIGGRAELAALLGPRGG